MERKRDKIRQESAETRKKRKTTLKATMTVKAKIVVQMPPLRKKYYLFLTLTWEDLAIG